MKGGEGTVEEGIGGSSTRWIVRLGDLGGKGLVGGERMSEESVVKRAPS